jgi:hypothetical protein
MAPLSSERRKELPKKEFAEPGARKYPIPNVSHARNALARVSEFGSPSVKAAVRAEVHRRFPGIKEGKK